LRPQVSDLRNAMPQFHPLRGRRRRSSNLHGRHSTRGSRTVGAEVKNSKAASAILESDEDRCAAPRLKKRVRALVTCSDAGELGNGRGVKSQAACVCSASRTSREKVLRRFTLQESKFVRRKNMPSLAHETLPAGEAHNDAGRLTETAATSVRRERARSGSSPADPTPEGNMCTALIGRLIYITDRRTEPQQTAGNSTRDELHASGSLL
jgi:hypothetical protein